MGGFQTHQLLHLHQVGLERSPGDKKFSQSLTRLSLSLLTVNEESLSFRQKKFDDIIKETDEHDIF